MNKTAVLWLKDTGERLGFTFLEAFAAAAALSPVFDLSTVKSAAIAGTAAGLSYLKSTLTGLVPGTISPVSLVSAPEGEALPATPVSTVQVTTPEEIPEP